MDRSDVNIEQFLSANKSMIVAPAGHGKTHSIVSCLENFQSKDKKILILTHTHAGIASIKEKISLRNIFSKSYEISTICSFALNLTLAYVPECQLPDDSNMNIKYEKAQNLACKLLHAKPIKSVINAKYEHVIVDEYQDCDIIQHQLINQLGKIIKVHILGDSMQGIFGFNGSPIDLEGPEFKNYQENCQTLNTPWRWINSGHPELGDEILQIRNLLKTKQTVDLRQYKHIEFIPTHKNDLYWHRKKPTDIPPEIIKTLRYYLNDKHNGNVLVLHPTTYSKDSRIKLIKNLFNIGMLESIDDSDFYITVSAFENKTDEDLLAAIVDFLRDTCNASLLGNWIRPNGSLVKVKKKEKQATFNTLNDILSGIKSNKTYALISLAISQLKKLFKLKIVRSDIYYTIERVLIEAHRKNITLSEALKNNRDRVRRIGRNIKGKYIGTTLLTKGLECDTVIVLNAHQFPDEKHLYVALSRCSNNLIVASDEAVLSPYKKQEHRKVSPDSIQLSLFPELD